jgi:uncharacterized spore protein YtfJ
MTTSANAGTNSATSNSPTTTSSPPASSARASFLERLASQTSARVAATTIVGAPIERDGVTIVPVARASWGFGGGAGSGGPDRRGSGEGTGGGGGASIRPVGYIEIKNGVSTFHPVFDPNTLLTLVLVLGSAFAFGSMARALGRAVRGR